MLAYVTSEQRSIICLLSSWWSGMQESACKLCLRHSTAELLSWHRSPPNVVRGLSSTEYVFSQTFVFLNVGPYGEKNFHIIFYQIQVPTNNNNYPQQFKYIKIITTQCDISNYIFLPFCLVSCSMRIGSAHVCPYVQQNHFWVIHWNCCKSVLVP